MNFAYRWSPPQLNDVSLFRSKTFRLEQVLADTFIVYLLYGYVIYGTIEVICLSPLKHSNQPTFVKLRTFVLYDFLPSRMPSGLAKFFWAPGGEQTK